ncbi:MAG: VOC family protein, partial [Actinomycetota bacterium]
MTNPVVHFEIMGGDPAAQQKFYADLLGWRVEASGPEMGFYGVVDTQGGEGINGGIGVGPEGSPSYTTIYVAVEDMKTTLEKAEELGAKVIVPITEIPNIVTFAMFLDR